MMKRAAPVVTVDEVDGDGKGASSNNTALALANTGSATLAKATKDIWTDIEINAIWVARDAYFLAMQQIYNAENADFSLSAADNALTMKAYVSDLFQAKVKVDTLSMQGRDTPLSEIFKVPPVELLIDVREAKFFGDGAVTDKYRATPGTVLVENQMRRRGILTAQIVGDFAASVTDVVDLMEEYIENTPSFDVNNPLYHILNIIFKSLKEVAALGKKNPRTSYQLYFLLQFVRALNGYKAAHYCITAGDKLTTQTVGAEFKRLLASIELSLAGLMNEVYQEGFKVHAMDLIQDLDANLENAIQFLIKGLASVLSVSDLGKLPNYKDFKTLIDHNAKGETVLESVVMAIIKRMDSKDKAQAKYARECVQNFRKQYAATSRPNHTQSSSSSSSSSQSGQGSNVKLDLIRSGLSKVSLPTEAGSHLDAEMDTLEIQYRQLVSSNSNDSGISSAIRLYEKDHGKKFYLIQKCLAALHLTVSLKDASDAVRNWHKNSKDLGGIQALLVKVKQTSKVFGNLEPTLEAVSTATKDFRKSLLAFIAHRNTEPFANPEPTWVRNVERSTPYIQQAVSRLDAAKTNLIKFIGIAKAMQLEADEFMLDLAERCVYSAAETEYLNERLKKITGRTDVLAFGQDTKDLSELIRSDKRMAKSAFLLWTSGAYSEEQACALVQQHIPTDQLADIMQIDVSRSNNKAKTILNALPKFIQAACRGESVKFTLADSDGAFLNQRIIDADARRDAMDAHDDSDDDDNNKKGKSQVVGFNSQFS